MSLTINEYPLIYILWNLFLAMIPFFLYSLVLRELKQKNHSLIKISLFAIVWLLFLPNSAYVINDVRHIVSGCQLNENRVCVGETWLIPFFFSYALIGYFIFVWQFRQFRLLVDRYFNKTVSLLSVPVLMTINTLGLMFGLVERYNSWDVFWRLDKILSSTLDYLLITEKLFNWLIYSLLLLFLYVMGELVISCITKNINGQKLFKNR